MRQTFYASGLKTLLFCAFLSCKTTKPPVELNVMEKEDEPEIVVSPIPSVFQKESELSEYRESRERKFDLLHTSLDLSFDLDNQWVLGKALLKLKPFFFDQEVLTLDAKDFDIHDVWLGESGNHTPLNFKYDQKKLEIFLPVTFSAADTLLVGIDYTAKPEEATESGGEAITDTRGLYFINPSGTEDKPRQIWTQGETSFSSKWFPTIDSPNERQTHDIRLTVEEGFLSVSNGRLVSQSDNGDGTRTDHWVMDLPHAPYLTAIAVGDFSRISDTWKDMEVNYYVEKGYERGAGVVFKHTPEMLGFFSDRLGVDYPWQKYDQVVVRDFVSGAMENTTVSIFMEALNLDEREALDSEWDYIIAHELFHQWFGNLVTNESWSNLPLNESFADYSEYLWFEHKEGKDKADMHHLAAMDQYFYEAQEKQEKLIRFHYENEDDMFDSHSYAKGGRILHMLRRHLGDDAFFASLNHYLRSHEFSSVEVHDLRLAFEEVTGRDMNWFFNQWFMASGHPVLEIKIDDSLPDKQLLTISQKQDLEKTPMYRLPFKVSMYRDGERIEKEYILEQMVQQFALENGPETNAIFVDEDMELLAEKKTYRGVEGFKRQFDFARAGVARLEALDSLTALYGEEGDWNQLIERAIDDPFHEVRGLALMRLPEVLGQDEVSPVLEGKVLSIAENDPENEVRAAAIALLSKLNGEKYLPLFVRLVEEPSYVVAGAALTALMDQKGDEEGKMQVFERLKGEKNIRMVVPLASFLTASEQRGWSDWYNEKLHELKGESLYYFIGYYGDYFASIEGEDREGAVKKLTDLAKDHPVSYIRLVAFQSLFGFVDDSKVLNEIMEIHQTESDERVRNYQQFFIEPFIDEK